MELLKEDLIISDNNFSVYEKTTDITPSEPKIGIGGYITVVDNNSGEIYKLYDELEIEVQRMMK